MGSWEVDKIHALNFLGPQITDFSISNHYLPWFNCSKKYWSRKPHEIRWLDFTGNFLETQDRERPPRWTLYTIRIMQLDFVDCFHLLRYKIETYI